MARLKMPPGSREMSFRSSASSAPTEIFVAVAIWRSDIPRFSRARFSRFPKSAAGLSARTIEDPC
jgi:hypothetical protein